MTHDDEERSPFNEAIGLALDHVAEDGGAVFRFDPPEQALATDGEPRMAHGGALAGCVEWVANDAVFRADRSGRYWMPLDLRIDFHRIAEPRPYRVTARVVKIGRRTAVADATIAAWDDPGLVVASGRVAMASIS